MNDPRAGLEPLVWCALLVAFGWTMVPQVYAVAMLVMTVAFWLFTYSDPAHRVESSVTWREQLAALKDQNVWKYCQ